MNSSPPLLVTVSARALSSIGFGVSIVTWIWFAWFWPSTKPLVQDASQALLVQRARRRSAPPVLQASMSSPRPPIVLVPIIVPNSPSNPRRRVYFADSYISPPQRSPSPPLANERIERPFHDPEPSQKPMLVVPQSDTSPVSSSSTLVHAVNVPPISSNLVTELVFESDSSSRHSSRPSLSLSTNVKKAFRRNSGTSIPDPGIPMAPSRSEKQVRRSSLGLSPPWSPFNRRNSARSATSPSITSSSASTPSPSSTASTSSTIYFSRKCSGRTSAPIPVPRTQPYAYPYYAQPPTMSTSPHVAHLRASPQFGDEIIESPITSGSGEANAQDTRGRERSDMNAKAQAALGHGRRPPGKRSASESWATGQVSHL